MTNTEINIAIAEACGWVFYCTNALGAKVWHKGPMVAGVDPINCDRILPDYCRDLNDMREARSTLNEVERTSYSMRLSAALGEPNTLWPLLDASARQQAEAFLKAKGLWRE